MTVRLLESLWLKSMSFICALFFILAIDIFYISFPLRLTIETIDYNTAGRIFSYTVLRFPENNINA